MSGHNVLKDACTQTYLSISSMLWKDKTLECAGAWELSLLLLPDGVL